MCQSRNALVIHRRVHTGEKPYQCGGCNVVYSQKGTLLRHMREKCVARKQLEVPQKVQRKRRDERSLSLEHQEDYPENSQVLIEPLIQLFTEENIQQTSFS